MATEPVEFQVVVLRVSIHCEGCKKKVKKVLLHIDGVYRCDIDARRNRVAVTVSPKIDAGILVARLRKSGKLAEPWPEEPKQQQEPPPPAESQSQETKNQADDASKPNEAAEKPAAEPSTAQPPAPEPEKTAEETPPPAEENKGPDEAKAETGPQQQPSEANEKAKQQQQQEQHGHHDKPMDARVTMEYDDARSRGVYGYGGPHQYMPATRQPPVHVMSYNVARPMASSSYYAAAPTPAAMPMPTPMARPGPSHGGYIDEYAPPNYYSRPAPSAYEPYYYPDSQPSPYGQHQRSAAEDYYYGAPPPPTQRSAFSPPREAYGDMFNDENANSCSVM
ncbi:heavy metal-associated isoprenylated plant protein 35-like [Triticum dicoccoides]|uniref:heavy metal-associated isoprenylated plant protein 35-like n=1 Tax=Triticum dicoccoides TaxID=85692 RepID=UPI000E7AFFE1|nr:heavy metal-associated isoprenylated plant protein 35-like [Triticum dicoccoides]